MMKHPAQKQDWILLVHQLPPKPTNLRVRVWRKLQKLGAVSLKNSLYVLPFNEKTHEDFQWLKQEVEAAGGEATVFRASSVDGATDDEIIASFRRQRAEEYDRAAAEFDALTGAISEQNRGSHLSPGRLAGYEAELGKLHSELERILATDFFQARERQKAVTAYERCQRTLHASQSRQAKAAAISHAAKGKSAALSPAAYQGKRWVTRRNLHIDRLASAWLIKRFIDGRARFYFVDEGASTEGMIPFDMFGVEFGHQGEDCTFETMLKRFGLEDDAGLRAVAEIVHDIDLKDGKFNRTEAPGLNAAVLGLSKLLGDDRKLLAQSGVIFEGLYALLSADGKKGKEDERESSRARAGNKRGQRSGRN